MQYVLFYRYTLFIVLYPIGITGELLCIFSATKYAKAQPEAWSYVLPNTWNFTFSYYLILIIIMLTYIPGKFSQYRSQYYFIYDTL